MKPSERIQTLINQWNHRNKYNQSAQQDSNESGYGQHLSARATDLSVYSQSKDPT